MSNTREAKRCGRQYVAVPRGVVEKWQHCPFSALWTAAQNGVDGISFVVDPGFDQTIEEDDPDNPHGEKKTRVIFVEEYPYRVKGASVFRKVGMRDGWNRDDVATLHSQSW